MSFHKNVAGACLVALALHARDVPVVRDGPRNGCDWVDAVADVNMAVPRLPGDDRAVRLAAASCCVVLDRLVAPRLSGSRTSGRGERPPGTRRTGQENL